MQETMKHGTTRWRTMPCIRSVNISWTSVPYNYVLSGLDVYVTCKRALLCMYAMKLLCESNYCTKQRGPSESVQSTLTYPASMIKSSSHANWHIFSVAVMVWCCIDISVSVGF